jgi:transcriptional regulator with XRE-family HTH domain
MELPPNQYRGLYGRVAEKLGVDASYVSRIARGQRHSVEVEAALREEVAKITRSLLSEVGAKQPSPAGRKGKRLRTFVLRDDDRTRQEFLSHSQNDSGLRSVQIGQKERIAPITPLIAECLKLMVFTPKQMRTKSTKAALQHGRSRQEAGFTPVDLVEEYNLIRRCIFGVAERHLSEMDTHMLFHDLSQMNEVLDLQLQNALTTFLSQPPVR